MVFLGLNGKIAQCDEGSCTGLNGEIEWFLHESEWGACMRLSKAASDRKLSVCLCENVGGEKFKLSRVEITIYIIYCYRLRLRPMKMRMLLC